MIFWCVPLLVNYSNSLVDEGFGLYILGSGCSNGSICDNNVLIYLGNYSGTIYLYTSM